MQHSRSILINRPPSDVWALTGNPRAWPKWVQGIENVQVEGGGELGLGATVTYRWRGRPVKAEVARYEPGRVFGIRSSEKNYDFHESMSLRERDDGTEVTFTMGFTPTAWWMSPLAVALYPAKSLLLGRPLKKELEALRQVAESD